MATLITDPFAEQEARQKREQWGGDKHDEVWEGVYFMPPMPNNEHQILATQFGCVFQEVLGWAGDNIILCGANISDREEDWKENYRVPDVVVFLKGTNARDCNTHWVGGPDFLVEILSSYDRTRDKLPFYGEIGVREALLVDRDPWQLELYRLQDGQLTQVGKSTTEDSAALASEVVPFTFRLVQGEAKPIIEVMLRDGEKEWRF